MQVRLVIGAHFFIAPDYADVFGGKEMGADIIKSENFEIVPCVEITDIDSKLDFQKLKLTSSQKIQMGGLLQHLPAVVATESMSKAYILKLPEGLSGFYHPMQYTTGGIGTSIQAVDGSIVGHASLHELSAQVTVLGIFNVMSIASGQYFLAQINSELKAMNQNIDKILEFLYGDKRAELISEVSFVKSAYQNYSSIMQHEQQRLATLVSLQEAKKIAMKDIEFYMSDLDTTVSAKSGSDITSFIDKTFQIKDCLELSIQLYSMSSLLEIYYSQNYDANYISNVEEEAVTYVGKCEKRMLSCFSKLSTQIQNFKEGPLKKIDKPILEKRVNSVVDSFSQGTESEILQSIRSVLHASRKGTECYVSSNGDLYLRKAS